MACRTMPAVRRRCPVHGPFAQGRRHVPEGLREQAHSAFEAKLARSETETGPGLGELAVLGDQIHVLGRGLQERLTLVRG